MNKTIKLYDRKPIYTTMVDKYEVKNSEIDDIIVTIGPGSYTGVRIALTIAKTISVSLGLNIYPVSALRVLKSGKKPSICIINARSNRSYIGVYCGDEVIMNDCILKNDEIIKEPSTMYPEKLLDNYNHSKALATKYVMDKRNENKDIMINILYPSAVIGINDYKPSAIGKVVKDIIANKMQFGIKGGYNFVDVTDISKATYNLLKQNNNEDYLLTGRYVSIIEFYKIVNSVLNKRKTTIKIPLFLVYPFIPFVPYLSKFVIKTINQNPNFDNSKFKQLLNKDITDFKETIKNTTEFFKNN